MRDCAYRKFETDAWRRPTCGRRTELHEFNLPGTTRRAMMKVTLIPESYSFTRKVESLVKALWRDYARLAFTGALALHVTGIAAPVPLACWRDRFFRFERRSYFLYEKAAASLSLADYLAGEQDSARCETLARRVAQQLRRLHEKKVRHGDLIARNILLRERNEEFELVLIDTDETSAYPWRIPFVSRFRDIGDLADATFILRAAGRYCATI